MGTLTDPFTDAAFVRGLTDVTLVAIVAGVVGTFIVIRGIGFLGDALAHSIFPGVVVAFLLESNLLAGALVAGLITAALMGVLTANARVRENTSIGVIFTAAFALGVVFITNSEIDGDELAHILFGDPLGASLQDVFLTAAIGIGVVSVVALMWRLLIIASFDPTGARAMGLSVVLIDVALLTLTALTVVVSFKAVGNILVVALLITPAATARLLRDRLLDTMLLACALGVVAGATGLYLGYQLEASAGGTIVLVSAGMFFVAWLFAPATGVVPRLLERRSGALLEAEPEAEAEVVLASPEIVTPHTP